MSTSSTDRLRYIPPIAALGTAFVLQVVVITDTVGSAAATMYPHAGGWAYAPAVLLGIAVASCAEGGAAYLMDLYDRHLLARDSVWLLRIAMAGYVAASGLAIHWWTDHRGLPTIISWLLSGMSASALFLWARGARWRNRQQMIAAGQIDPAMPRLPMSAKLLHPVRWAATLFLISWNPVATTDEARARYDEWQDRRTGRTARTELYVQSMIADAEQRAAVVLDDALAIADMIGQAAREELSAYWQAATERALTMHADADSQAAATLSAAKADADSVRLSAQDEADAILSAARTEADRMLAAAKAAKVSAEQDAATVRSSAQADMDRLLAEATAVRQAAEQLSADAARTAEQATSAGDQSKRTSDTRRPARTGRTGGTRAEVSVEQLADTLDEHFPDKVPGRPSALPLLKQVYGSCSGERAIAAIELLRVRRNGHREQAPDAERLPLTVPNTGQGDEQTVDRATGHVNGHRPNLELIGAA
ncbi:hypothetical protein ABT369_39065 [Dactylosporangium sp. NPDC000244]|uniref:hypothetical protein n=1 Tax=Dactylosporangium sp. NPDC000244 TaxID=3154365 RepID=UPI00332A2561